MNEIPSFRMKVDSLIEYVIFLQIYHTHQAIGMILRFGHPSRFSLP
jgi:hypothetical protein